MTVADADTRIAAEFRAATEGAAVFSNPAGRLRLTGADARDLLNRLSTNKVDPQADAGDVVATVLTSDRGRIVDLVYVIHCGDHQLMLTGPGRQPAVIDFLDKYTIMEDLEVEDITDATVMLTLTGPTAGAVLDRAGSIDARRVAAPANPDDTEASPHYHLLCSGPDAADRALAMLREAGAAPISAAAAETLRIASHRPAAGAEMSDTYNPLEAGLIGAIDFHKGCYIGQEVIARLDTYQKVQKYLVSLDFLTDASALIDVPNLAAIAESLPGARLVNAAGDAMGVVTSATVAPAPDGFRVIGLGYVRTAAVGGRQPADRGIGWRGQRHGRRDHGAAAAVRRRTAGPGWVAFSAHPGHPYRSYRACRRMLRAIGRWFDGLTMSGCKRGWRRPWRCNRVFSTYVVIRL